MIRGGQAVLQVADMERAVAFYGGVLGLPVQGRRGSDWATFRTGSGTILRLHGPALAAGDAVDDVAPGVRWQLFVDEPLELVLAQVAERGGRVRGEAHHAPDEPGRSAFVEDPEGHLVRLTERLPPGRRELAARRRTTRRRLFALLGLGALALLASLWLGPWYLDAQRAARRARLVHASKAAQELAVGLRAYAEEHGRPPTALADLLPRHLVELPETGIPGHPDFEYLRTDPPPRRTARWFLESDTRPVPTDRSGTPALEMTVGPGGRVLDAHAEHVPVAAPAAPFDAAAWARRVDRARMVGAISDHVDLGAAALDEVMALLGGPDELSRPSAPPWELALRYRHLGFVERWVYWPRHDDEFPGPDHELLRPTRDSSSYAVSPKRVGDWVRLVEPFSD